MKLSSQSNGVAYVAVTCMNTSMVSTLQPFKLAPSSRDLGPMSCPPKERPHPITKEHIPVTMGHEFSGRIISAPPSSGLTPDQAVIVDPRIFCRSCSRCKDGNTNGCMTLGFKGLSGTGGGFSSMIAVDARMCHPLPNDTDLSLAALIEPLTVAWHAITATNISSWSSRSVLVVGGGPVGIACVFVLRAFGCRKIIVSEPTAVRAEQNRAIADVLLNPIEDDVGGRCRELTGGAGVDIVFDCAGNQKGFEAGMDALRYRGCYMNVAVWFGSPVSYEIYRYRNLRSRLMDGCSCNADANPVLFIHAERDHG